MTYKAITLAKADGGHAGSCNFCTVPLMIEEVFIIASNDPSRRSSMRACHACMRRLFAQYLALGDVINNAAEWLGPWLDENSVVYMGNQRTGEKATKANVRYAKRILRAAFKPWLKEKLT